MMKKWESRLAIICLLAFADAGIGARAHQFMNLRSKDLAWPKNQLIIPGSTLAESKFRDDDPPKISLSASLDAVTPTYHAAYLRHSAVPCLNPEFGYDGYSPGEVEQGDSVRPGYDAVRGPVKPAFPKGFGSVYAAFETTAPSVSFRWLRGQFGSVRILCDDGNGINEILRCTKAVHAGIADDGASSNIKLDGSASANDGSYYNDWIHLVSSKGENQWRRIIAYDGKYKLASVDQPWDLLPDSSSKYEITQAHQRATWSTHDDYSSYYFKFEWNGTPRTRKFYVENDGCFFFGVWTPRLSDSIHPIHRVYAAKCYVVGDSFADGTGSDGRFSSLSRVFCDDLNWECRQYSIGGTGYVAVGKHSLNFADRLVPPLNSWNIQVRTPRSGTYQLSQAGHSVTVQIGETTEMIQKKFDESFGNGKFQLAGDGSASLFAIGKGSNALVQEPMTATWNGLSGPSINQCSRWKGVLANSERDANGNELPFYLVLAGGRNDGLNQSLVQSECQHLLERLQADHPNAKIFVLGAFYAPGSPISESVLSVNEAIKEAATSRLIRINGFMPFIDTLNVGGVRGRNLLTGTGFEGSLKGDGNSDLAVRSDGIHPTLLGHAIYGHYISKEIKKILQAKERN